MMDINNMCIYDFNNLYEHIARKDKIRRNEPVALRESNRRMIQNTKDKEKNKKV